jgi:hypothetical protein
MADAINRLREGKESLFPDYIRRLAEAQLEYYHSCVRASEQLLQSLNSGALSINALFDWPVVFSPPLPPS